MKKSNFKWVLVVLTLAAEVVKEILNSQDENR